MSKDRTTPELAPLLARPLGLLTRALVRRPRAVTLGCVAVAVLAGLAAVNWLGFRTNRLDLLNPASEFHQRWLAYLREFGSDDDLVILVTAPQPTKLTATTKALAAALADRPAQYRSIIHEQNLERLRRKGLHLVPAADLQRLALFVEQARPLVAQEWAATSPEQFPAQLSAQLMRAMPGAQGLPSEAAVARASFESVGDLATLASAASTWATEVDAAVHGRSSDGVGQREFAKLVTRFDEMRARPVLLDDGQSALVVLRLADDDPQDPRPRAAAISELRNIMGRLEHEHAGVELQLTGMSVLEDDEMRASQADMTWASALSFLSVVVILWVGFRRWRYALLAVATLVIGMAWSFGFIAIWPGHLNLLSVSFAAILIGLGIDFGIHYLSHYVNLRDAGMGVRGALTATAQGIGPGVLTGALTTAVAFFAAAHSEFTGVAELGGIAGAGVLLCLAAAIVALPPLVVWLEPRRREPAFRAPLGWTDWLIRSHRHPATLCVFLAACGAASFGLEVLHYDHNLLHLQTEGLESVELEQRLTEQNQRSVWFAVSLADDLSQLKKRKAEFEKLPSVARVEEIGSLVAEVDPQRREVVARIHAALTSLPTEVPLLPAPSSEALRAAVGRLLGQLSALPLRAKELAATQRSLGQLAESLAKLPAETVTARLAGWRQATVEAQWRACQSLRELASADPPSWDDLPPQLVERFRGKSGKHLLRVYARDDIWDLAPLQKFVQDLESVDPRVTGHPVQTFYASQQVQRSYVHSGVYALICVLIVVYLDFRHFGHALLSLVPLLVSFLLTFGLAGWLGLPLNAANLLVLPLLLGIGIDAGVHVVHDWRSQAAGYQLSRSLALSILLCSTTTIAGFAGLVLARHQGLRSLGIVLCLGMAISLATSLVLLPACLTMFSGRVAGKAGARRRQKPAGESH